jgi:hypothetical protein
LTKPVFFRQLLYFNEPDFDISIMTIPTVDAAKISLSANPGKNDFKGSIAQT